MKKRGREGKPRVFIGPEMAIVFLICGLVVLGYSYLITPKNEIPIENGGEPVAFCITCIEGVIGGGCTYQDQYTGELIQPQQCVQYDTSREKHFCTDEQRGAIACILIYQPVCGSDAREYSNSCFACANENVIFYLDGTCGEVTIK